MEKVLVVLASSSAAHAVKTMLEKRYKIYSRIVQAPSCLSVLGCTYCIELNRFELRTAINLIKVSGLSIRGVYDAKTYQKINM